ncbi:MAG: hypothetical protein UX74_C0001G0045 [Parcubacteria group bacterium GW2011_GWA2_47_10b]|nr:MAG: hypothetical protein UX74_C0001G0045 [Parcubacteria group bacterium GW2011_GWA2_47_10b]
MATSASIVSNPESGRKFVLVGIGLLFVVVVAYFFYGYYQKPQGDAGAPVVETSNSDVSGASLLNPNLPEEGRAILNELDILKKIKPLDTKFFEEPGFASLRETKISIPSVEPTPGREFQIELSQ